MINDKDKIYEKEVKKTSKRQLAKITNSSIYYFVLQATKILLVKIIEPILICLCLIAFKYFHEVRVF